MKLKLTLFSLVFFYATVTYAVDYMTIIDSMSARGATFDEITTAVDKAWEGKFQGKHSGRKQYERWKYYNSTRLDKNGRLQNTTKLTWDEFYSNQAKAPANKAAGSFTGNWESLGKTTYDLLSQGYSGGIGRVNCVTVDPANSDIVYIGTPGGGLWRSTDNGSSWSPMIDGMPRLGVSSITIDPSSPANNRTIYILTGDGDAQDVHSLGVYKSIDNGATWMSTGLGEETGISYKMVMHPTNFNTLYVASQHGIYKTTNGGLNWTLTVPADYLNMNRVVDIEFNTANPDILYATTYKASVYISTNAGQSWQKMGSGLPTEASVNYMRTAVAVTPANSNYIYILYGATYSNYKFAGIYRSTDGGNSFTLQADYPNILGGRMNGLDTRNQSNYDLAIAVSPVNANLVHVGGINAWKSTDGGVTWENTAHWEIPFTPIGNYTHADIHALEYVGNTLYCGSDGGIFRSTDHADNWIDISDGLEITQFYRIGGKPNDPNLLLGGAQDNGSILMDNSSTMHQWYGADGMECFFDANNDQVYYGSIQQGGLIKTDNAGTNIRFITPIVNGSRLYGEWVTPYCPDPNNSNTIYAGYKELYKSTDGGTSWEDISNGAFNTTMNITQIGVSSVNSNCVYANSNGKLYRTTDGGVNWTFLTGNIQYVYSISGFCFNPDNIDEIWVYLSSMVYYTTNGGASWTNISKSIPTTSINTMVYQTGTNGRVYAGTDAGVFYTDNTMTEWVNFSNGLVNVEIFELEINSQTNKIRAATYGRGVWESDIDIDCNDPATVSIPAPAKNANKAIGTSYTIQANAFISTTGTFDDSPYGGPGFGVNSTASGINYVNTNDVAVYSLPANIEDGIYEVDYYISTPINGAAISLSVDNGSPVMTDAVPNNGGWDSYVQMNASQTITLQNGTNSTISLKGAGTSTWEWNLSRFELTKVAELSIPVSGVTLSADSVTLDETDTYQLTETVLPTNASNKQVTWSSDNEPVATVNNGLITAVSEGNATITVTTNDGNYTATCYVTVNSETGYIPVTGITISDDYEMLTMGSTYQLTATVLPTNATNQNFEWSSDDETVATINANGLVTATGGGNTLIRATTEEFGFTALCEIEVPTSTNITVEAESFTATGGTVDDSQWGGPGYGYAIDGTIINWCNTGDWVDYSITIPMSGKYEIVYYLATAINGAAIEISFNGTAYLTDQVASTGGWDVFQPLTASKFFELYAGNYTIRLRGVGTQGWEWNMDKFTLTRVDDICVSNANLKAHYSELPGTYAGPMPGLIQEVEGHESGDEGFTSDKNSNEHFSFYPNPANTQVTLAFNVRNSKHVSIQIMNIVGEVKATVVNQSFDNGSYEMVYDLNMLTSGIYLVQYRNGSSQSIQKLVIE